MDDSDTLNISAEDIQRLSPTDQRELQKFVQVQNQQANVQRCEHILHDRNNLNG